MMLKVLLVDDDILVRVGLKMMINWAQCGFEIVGEASNGVQALEIYSTLKPDLIIIDMKMPQMNGTELIKVLKSRNEKIKIIILSCYDDFNYMKDALNYGASDYILKSEMEKETFEDTLKRICNEISDEISKNRELIQLKEQVAWSNLISKEQLINDILNGEIIEKSEIEFTLDYAKVKFVKPSFVVAVFSIDKYKSIKTSMEHNRLENLRLSIFNIIQGIISYSPGNVLISDNNKDGFIAIFNLDEDETVLKHLLKVADNVIKAINTYLDLSLTIGISSMCNDVISLEKLFKQAQTALKYRIFDKFNTSIYYDSIKNYESSILTSFDKYSFRKTVNSALNNIDMNIGKDSYNEIPYILDNILFEVKEAKSINVLGIFCSDIVSWYNKRINELNVNLTLDELENYIDVSMLSECNSMIELKEVIMAKIAELFNLKNNDNINCSNIIRKSLQFIHNNYCNNIGLEDVANYVNISKNYLSILFREQTGHNFIEYLNNYRVDIAKKKLQMEDCKIYEIALTTGFSNERYFSQVFKGIVGITPGDYKKQFYKS
jgi:two-component system, response regulator YesN